MLNHLHLGKGARRKDEENPNEILVDLSQSRWIIDLDLDNIITRISENKTWADTLRDSWQALKGNGKVQALQNYEYMEKRSLHPGDPFYVSGERYHDRQLLRHIIGDEADRLDDQMMFKAIGDWQKHPAGPEFASDTRRDNYRRAWTKGFHQRLGVAAVGGVFLIAPMWLMVLHNTLYTGLASTTAFVVVFGLMAAVFLTSLVEVMSSTAAYAAVLVVFVGLTTDNKGAS
ncbi:hypothetical protein ACJ41O_010334 [Fusarium nematophilum]